MASKKTHKRKSSASRSNAGTRRASKKMSHKRARRHNPAGLGRPIDWVKGGAGVIGGAVGSRVIPQLAGSANTGAMGYGLNLLTAVGLGFLAHMALKDVVITAGVIAGGFAATFVRIATDQTQYGQYLALSGVGDYVVWNFSSPQRVTGPNANRINTAYRMDAAMVQDPMIAGSIDRFRG